MTVSRQLVERIAQADQVGMGAFAVQVNTIAGSLTPLLHRRRIVS